MRTADRIIAAGGALATMRLTRNAYLRGVRHGVILAAVLVALALWRFW